MSTNPRLLTSVGAPISAAEAVFVVVRAFTLFVRAFFALATLGELAVEFQGKGKLLLITKAGAALLRVASRGSSTNGHVSWDKKDVNEGWIKFDKEKSGDTSTVCVEVRVGGKVCGWCWCEDENHGGVRVGRENKSIEWAQ